jgi:hypothetical protein
MKIVYYYSKLNDNIFNRTNVIDMTSFLELKNLIKLDVIKSLQNLLTTTNQSAGYRKTSKSKKRKPSKSKKHKPSKSKKRKSSKSKNRKTSKKQKRKKSRKN